MKRFIMFCAVVAAFVICPAFLHGETAKKKPVLEQIASQTEPPEVVNPSFEAAQNPKMPDGWWGPEKNFQRDETVARTGSASFRWTNDDPNNYVLSSSRPKNLIPGNSYLLSGWVKTKDVKGGKAAICIEWNGPDGKWAGGAYLQGVNGTKDWTRIFEIVRFPMDAQNPHLTCYGTRDATGTAWFDDLEIVPYFPPCITQMSFDCYRAQTTGDQVKLFVGVSYVKADFAPELLKEISVGLEGQKIQDYEWDEDLNALVFTVPTKDLALGKHTVTVSVPNPGLKTKEVREITLTKVEKFPERKSFIDPQRRLIVDGKPFFPLGLYFGGVTHEDVLNLADSPFNCIMPYHPISRETLDDLYAHGISVIYSVKDLYEGLQCQSDEEGREKTIKRINELKDHPGIIAWYINDELPLSMLEQLSGHRDLCEELDPGRPTWVVLYQVEQIRDYLPTFDVIGTDPYPISGKPASTAYKWAKMTCDGGFGLRPCWQVPQLFNWANYRKNDKNARTPTYDEIRAMTWMNLAGGATGIIGYSYFDMPRNFSNENPTPEAKKESFDRSWAMIKKVGEEIKKYESVFLTGETIDPIPFNEGSDAEIVSRTYALDGTIWLLTVNSDTEAKTAEFTVPAGKTVKNAADWPGAKVQQNGQTVKIELDGLTPAFLQIQ
ncbi:MAG: hypothetical protein IJU53_04915 [Thermoguttaceae bacterium]|nr:hypothetical protein [Thermoguttaceae bacterium]